MQKRDTTWEAQQMADHPDVKQSVVDSAQFQTWLSGLASVEIDGTVFFTPWGDIPMDRDQCIYHFARQHGYLDERPGPPDET